MNEEIHKLYNLLPDKVVFKRFCATELNRSYKTISNHWFSNSKEIPAEFQNKLLQLLKDFLFSEKTKILIQKKGGRWLLNDKAYPELSEEEKHLFDDFIKYHRDIYNSCNCKKSNCFEKKTETS